MTQLQRRLEHQGSFTATTAGVLYIMGEDDSWRDPHEDGCLARIADEGGELASPRIVGSLRVHVDSCSSLLGASGLNGSSDPYVVLSHGASMVNTAPVIGTLSPRFRDQPFTLRYVCGAAAVKRIVCTDVIIAYTSIIAPLYHRVDCAATDKPMLRVEVFSDELDRQDVFLGELEIDLLSAIEAEDPTDLTYSFFRILSLYAGVPFKPRRF